MSRKDILKKVEEIFQDMLDDNSIVITEEVSEETLPEWDSLFHITLIASVEDEFKIHIATDDIVNVKDVGKLVDIIMKELEVN